MVDENSRTPREKKTIRIMIQIYCKAHHDSQNEICEECSELLDYAFLRLDKCKFQEDKPTCAKCPVHCYKSTMREKIRAVMRYSGPRMMFSHPILAIKHVMDGKKEGRK
jgi:hypothetical protein